MFLVGNTNNDTSYMTLGKKNEAASGIGRALAMLMRYKYDIDIDVQFPNLMNCDKLTDILSNSAAKHEIMNYVNLWNYLRTDAYAKSELITKHFSASVYRYKSTNTSGTFDLVIPEDLFTGNNFYYLYAWTSFSETYKREYTFKINNVTMVSTMSATSDYSNSFLLTPEVLAQYNITEPGTYPVYLYTENSSNGKVVRSTTNLDIDCFKTPS